MAGARLLLSWLETLSGETWQERWNAAPASASYDNWQHGILTWASTLGRSPSRTALKSGLLALICADVIRPSMEWLAGNSSRFLRPAIAATRDPTGFARLASDVSEHDRVNRNSSEAFKFIAQIVAAYGGSVDDIVVGDLLTHPKLVAGSSGKAVRLAYTWLRNRGQFPPDAPVTLNHVAVRTGQLRPAELIDRYELRCQPIRDLLVDYLTERQPTLDYTSLRTLARELGGLFWADLEHHHPGIDTLRLPKDVSDAWKARIAVKTTRRHRPDGTIQTTIEPR